ncbi:MAG: hypothetical protein GF341_10475 [candidate division Zixibacteria bacterium]|nr:hypothetical protein [candidate division Zixibacteria bacterium]
MSTTSTRSAKRRTVAALSMWLVLSVAAAASAQTPQQLDFGPIPINYSQSPVPDLATEIEAAVQRLFSGPATEQATRNGLRSLVAILESQGYRHASIAPSAFTVNDETLAFTLSVQPGPRSIVRDILFSGTTHTDTSWLHNVTAIPTDVPLTARWLNDALDRINRVSHLRCAADPSIEIIHTDPERAIEHIRASFAVTEDAPSRFDGLIAANSQGDQTALTGRASLEFGGLFGRDRTVAVHFDRPRPEWRTFNIRYHENGAVHAPLSWSVELDELTRHHRRQSVRARADYLVPGYRAWTGGVGGLWRRVTPNGSAITPARISEASVSIERHTHRRNIERTIDLALSLDAAYSHRRTLGAGDAEQSHSRLRISQEADMRIRLNHSWGVAISAAGYWWPVGDDALGPGDEWYLGGADRLRGYEQQWFAANSGLWGALEVERHVGPLMRLSAFAEAASLKLVAEADSDTPYSYGWAVTLQSLQRVGRLEFAWGRGMSLRDGIIRLRISHSW